MTISEKLKNNFPSTLSKSGKFFSAFIANDQKTGAIEKELYNIVNYMKEWKNINNVYDSKGTALEYISSFFTYLERFTDEKEKSYLDRIKAIFVRGGDVTWGTAPNILHTFKNYFNVDTIYLLEKTNDKSENKFQNYVFDDLEGWVSENAELSKEARFSKTNGILFHDGTISQTVNTNVDKGYYIHFFYKGQVSIEVENGKIYKWDHKAEIYRESDARKDFTSDKWSGASFYFKAKSDSVNVKFSGTENTYFDYPMFFEKKRKKSFTLFVQFTGATAKNALALSPGGEDPNEEIKNYELAGYYDDTYLTGANSGFAIDLYADLLEYVKAVGVKAYLEIVNRDQDS